MSDISVQPLREWAGNDLHDLCDAAEAAIREGGGFGWLAPPPRDVMEAHWRGVLLIPERTLFVGRLEGVIAGSAQLARPSRSHESRAHAAAITTFFVVPWARGHGLSSALLEACEMFARREGHTVINLDVRETQRAAIAVFEANGYRQWGVDPNYARVHGEYVAGHYYQKLLQSQ